MACLYNFIFINHIINFELIRSYQILDIKNKMSQEQQPQSSLQQIVNVQIQALKKHRHIPEITKINSLTYKILYHPQYLDTLYSTQLYSLKLSIPQSYPQSAPFIIFLDKIYHLNIHPSSGQLFISILKYDWSPYLDLYAVFCTLDQVMEQPDQQCSATQRILQQYQQNIQSYIQNVNEVIKNNHSNKPISSKDNHNNHNKDNRAISNNNNNTNSNKHLLNKNNSNRLISHNNINRPISNNNINRPISNHGIRIQTQNSMVQDYKSDSIQEVIEVRDLSYQNLQNGTSNKIKQNQQSRTQYKITTINHMPISNTQKNIKRQDKLSQYNKRGIFNEQRYEQKNNNFKLTQQQLEFSLLKQQKHRISELISIFSAQLCQLQQKRILLQNRLKLKQIIQKKCTKLEQMLIQLFQLSQQINNKIMNLLRNNRIDTSK